MSSFPKLKTSARFESGHPLAINFKAFFQTKGKARPNKKKKKKD